MSGATRRSPIWVPEPSAVSSDMSMVTLITGAGGMLGRDLARVLPPDAVALGSDKLDVTDAEQVRRALREYRPQVVFHTAAYTDVDGCELDPERAFRVNALGTRNVAQAAEAAGASVVYISTDYVFDGVKSEPYIEFDAANPLGVYGKSKLAGEQFVRELCRCHYIIRTAWLFGKHGKNFVRTMMRLGREREEIRVVSDQVGSPTYTRHLAGKVVEIVSSGRYGTYHVTNSGCCSRFEFARAILRRTGSGARLVPVSTSEYPVPARRPKNGVLRNFVLQLEQMEPLGPWQDALDEYLAELP